MKGDAMLRRAAAVVGERRRVYGDPRRSMEAVARRWSVTLGHPVTPAQVVLCLSSTSSSRDLPAIRVTRTRSSMSQVMPRCWGRSLHEVDAQGLRRQAPLDRAAQARRLARAEPPRREPAGSAPRLARARARRLERDGLAAQRPAAAAGEAGAAVRGGTGACFVKMISARKIIFGETSAGEADRGEFGCAKRQARAQRAGAGLANSVSRFPAARESRTRALPSESQR